ncbi:PEP-CTERM sorting domain-containing protein [Aeoliella mucimassa]|uniref:PEP-CTERM protein-sorting domain-containing protein n=1 Tax=Aeoliella mucimassa TaxID=2527972 RepID=A0A518ASD5_9BACT|nr:PEP-CTERM sorting domain-containing protein [Aeoliella mucimassa]QDU57643.1 hypothetical protein Pan181_38620 [Aeoliella mucimassa]
MKIYCTLIALIASLGFQAATFAAFVEPQSWTRGDGGTTYQEWGVFDAYPTDNTPDVGDINPNGTASLTENTGTAFTTSSGNIYGPGGATEFTVTIPEADVPTPQHDITAVVQFSTLGTELDYTSVLLNGLAPVDTAEIDRVALGGFGGSQIDTWMLFNVPYADFGDGVAGVEDLTLEFTASGAHMSLAALSIDTAIRPFGFYAEPNPVPEPTSIALCALIGAGGLVVAARRRFDLNANV